MKRGCRSIPLIQSVEAAGAALGLLPSMALSSAQHELIIAAMNWEMLVRNRFWSMALLPWGKDHVGTHPLPPGGYPT